MENRRNSLEMKNLKKQNLISKQIYLSETVKEYMLPKMVTDMKLEVQRWKTGGGIK
jgi:hypothetical protein